MNSSRSTSSPLLVFGGPYSNLQAVEALMAQASLLAIPPERIICTGDVVAYCGHPEETVAAIRAWGIHVVQGNCEEQLAVAAADCGCGFEEGTTCDRLAKSWYEFANARLSSESRRWMGSLPRQLDLMAAGARVRVVHGGVAQINRFLFASQRDQLAAELESSAADVVLAGHCGLPFIEDIDGKVWFNPGVIGMPANDGTPRVWYGLIEEQTDPNAQKGLRFSLHPLSYDHEAAAAAVRTGGYASAYAEALLTGLWPSLDVLPAAERAATGRALVRRSQDVVMRTTERGRVG